MLGWYAETRLLLFGNWIRSWNKGKNIYVEFIFVDFHDPEALKINTEVFIFNSVAVIKTKTILPPISEHLARSSVLLFSFNFIDILVHLSA